METGIELAGRYLLLFAVATIRIECALRFIPAFSTSIFTGIARRVTVMAWSILLFPIVLTHSIEEPSMTLFLVMVAREVIVGCCFGFLSSLPFHISEMVGNMIDNQRGATMGEMFSPLSGSQAAPTATFLLQCIIALFYTCGGITLFLSALYESYLLFPLDVVPLTWTTVLPQHLLAMIDGVMRSVVLLSAPALLLMVLATLGLGIINRSAPQLNVFFLSMPIKSALGLWVLLWYLPYFLEIVLPTSSSVFLNPLLRWWQ